MNKLTDGEIHKASATIDKALLSINNTNRGEVASRVLSIVRNLNDNIADKVWSDLRPSQKMDVNKVASKFVNIRPYQFIAKFDKFLRASVSHFTPSEEGAERLMIKYYRYLIQLKELVHTRYGMDILANIDYFLEDLDEQTKNYYAKVATQIATSNHLMSPRNFDNYYIDKIKPFFVNRKIYFEVTLEPASEKMSKFNRITAFTASEICTNYCVSLSFHDTAIDVFDVNFPIKIITEWHVSIRPCEINNFARILNITASVQRSSPGYKSIMTYLQDYQASLVDILDYDQETYNYTKDLCTSETKNKYSVMFNILDKCRRICAFNLAGKNILRYLLYRMNNRIIKDQWPLSDGKTYAGLYLSSKCMPFDQHPFSFYPAKHLSNIFDLFECIEVSEQRAELLARFIEKNTSENGILFTPVDDLNLFGDFSVIKTYVSRYNTGIYSGFRPNSELNIYKNYVYNKGHELETVKILLSLKRLSNTASETSLCFLPENINSLRVPSEKNPLDDPEKALILQGMFSQSRVHLIYGAAGTGKTTLVNFISKLMSNKQKVFLAKTTSAVENLRRKVCDSNETSEFVTVDRFTRNPYYQNSNYDLIVVDECSTVKNEELLKILKMMGNSVLVLVGDTYQIEAIGFGNWFSICRNVMPSSCCHELTTPHRSSDEFLTLLWKEVRNMGDDNIVLEKTVRSDYSHPIDNDIFIKKSNDEIILCFNYDGLYGLNNINRLLQLSNPNASVNIGILNFKIGDPLLFNNSNRFSVLYNNLKGKIINIIDQKHTVYFAVSVDTVLNESDVDFCEGLDYIYKDESTTTVGFTIRRTPPYYSDDERVNDECTIPFQVAYAVSIHKSQGLEYDSVKIVIADETEERISHNIFYTAITRAKKALTIYWSPEVCNRILARIRPTDYRKDYYLLKEKNNL